jgi:hypothetical protein
MAVSEALFLVVARDVEALWPTAVASWMHLFVSRSPLIVIPSNHGLATSSQNLPDPSTQASVQAFPLPPVSTVLAPTASPNFPSIIQPFSAQALTVHTTISTLPCAPPNHPLTPFPATPAARAPPSPSNQPPVCISSLARLLCIFFPLPRNPLQTGNENAVIAAITSMLLVSRLHRGDSRDRGTNGGGNGQGDP